MKHIFILNPAAGKCNQTAALKEQITSLSEQLDVEMHMTDSRADTTKLVRALIDQYPDGELRFYACGGDGTLNGVVSGAARGGDRISVACYPCGSGNDYVKHYGGKDAFLDLPALMEGEAYPVDVMKIGDRYSINVVNFGFDTAVAETMENVRRYKIIGGRNSYTTGIVKALVTAMSTKCAVYADGELINDGKLLLCTVANGSYVGGSFRCAPRSVSDDGWMEVCLVKPVSRLSFLRLVSYYKKGLHLNSPKFKKYIVYRRARELEVKVKDGFSFTLDGEVAKCSDFTVENLKHAVRFVLPEGAAQIDPIPPEGENT
ncbi:MAG: YegS/Rv2252/BmrU family lipid kinase [Clostridia bacterium]|nr:YegS/Rv2252/BmrU family lipid kinase [Clostridia bacterium]